MVVLSAAAALRKRAPRTHATHRCEPGRPNGTSCGRAGAIGAPVTCRACQEEVMVSDIGRRIWQELLEREGYPVT